MLPHVPTCVSTVTCSGSSVARAITDVTWVKACKLPTSTLDTCLTMNDLIWREKEKKEKRMSKFKLYIIYMWIQRQPDRVVWARSRPMTLRCRHVAIGHIGTSKINQNLRLCNPKYVLLRLFFLHGSFYFVLAGWLSWIKNLAHVKNKPVI